MKKVYVKKPCMSKTIVDDIKIGSLEARRVLDIDEKTDKKLFDLKLVEEYDEERHGKADAENPYLAKLKETNIALDAANEKIAELKETNVALDGFVQAAMKLQKGQAPDGYVKAS